MLKQLTCVLMSLILIFLAGCNSNVLELERPKTTNSTESAVEQSSTNISNPSEETPSAVDNALPVTEFKLSDYGGKGDGKTDNIKAIKDALNAAKYTQGKKVIVLDEGKYLLSPSDFVSSIIISGFVNLEIKGQGSNKTEIVVDNPKGGFAFIEKSQNITLTGFSLDWDPLPFTQGVIVAKDDSEGTFDLKIDEGFPTPDGTWYTEVPKNNPLAMRWGVIVDPSGKGLKRNAFDHLFTSPKVTKLSDRVYRMYTQAGHGAHVASLDLAVGDKYAQITRFNDGGGITFAYCKNAVVDDLIFYSSPGMCIVHMYTDGAVVRNTSIKIKDGTNRYITSNGDGFHFGGNKSGPIVEGCYTEGMCDDAVNIGHGYPTNILERVDNRNIIVDSNNTVEKGHTVIVFNPREGDIKVKAKVIAKKQEVTQAGKEGSMLTLDADIPDIVLTEISATSDYLINPDVGGSGFVIRNNYFGPQRVRNIFIQTHSGVIENNVLEGSGGYGMFITNEAIYPSTMFPYNITIRNNTIKNSGVSKGMADMPNGASVLIQAQKYPVDISGNIYPSANARITTDIKFIGNKIINPPAAALYVGAAKDVEIENNEFSADKSHPTKGDKSLIVLDNCEGVKVKNNTITDEREGTIAGLRIKSNVAGGSNGVLVENLKASLAKGAKDVLDER